MTDDDKLRFEFRKGFSVLDDTFLNKISHSISEYIDQGKDMAISFTEGILGYLLYKNQEAYVQVLSKLRNDNLLRFPECFLMLIRDAEFIFPYAVSFLDDNFCIDINKRKMNEPLSIEPKNIIHITGLFMNGIKVSWNEYFYDKYVPICLLIEELFKNLNL